MCYGEGDRHRVARSRPRFASLRPLQKRFGTMFGQENTSNVQLTEAE